MTLHQKLKEIAKHSHEYDIPRLVKALELCREQRNIMIGLHHGDYAEAINKITGMFDDKLEEILNGTTTNKEK